MEFKKPDLKIKHFEEMNLPFELLTALQKMKITQPTEIQSQAIPTAQTGCDLIAIAQTGSGKTLAFALPLLKTLTTKMDSRALILVPSREMAQQIQGVFLELCAEIPISTCLVIGGTPNALQVSQLKKKPRLIIATPGRLNDHLQTNKLLLQQVEMIVIDEADRMLDMGFAPQLKQIKSTLRGTQQILMFSASFGPPIETIAKLFMKEPITRIRAAQAEEPVESLKQKVIFLEKNLKNDLLVKELQATQGGVILFAGDQESCEFVGKYLKEYGFTTDYIHGGLTPGHRNRILREFRSGKIRIMVTTDLLARGLDVPHVEYVINFDLPFQSEDFLHRIGRTARAGKAGKSITFVTPSEEYSYKKIKVYLKGALEVKVDPDFKFRAPYRK